MVGKSQAYIEDEIAIKLEDYEWALKKHGIKSVLGMVSEALDGKYLVGTSGIASTLSLAGYPTLAVFAASGLIIGKVGVKIGQILLEYEDIECGPNNEISWVYEIKKKISSAKPVKRREQPSSVTAKSYYAKPPQRRRRIRRAVKRSPPS